MGDKYSNARNKQGETSSRGTESKKQDFLRSC